MKKLHYLLLLVIPSATYGDFFLDFTNRDDALAIFNEDEGKLTTDSSLACMRPDHLSYNTHLDGEPNALQGLVVTLDNLSPTCSSSAQISVGHMSSISKYSYGDFEIYAKIAHSPPGSTDPHPPSNAFTCFSLYVGTSEAEYHNEIALCWSPSNFTQIHFGYWIGYDGDKEHQIIKDLGFDFSESYHTYAFQWRPTSITWLVDGKVLATSQSGQMPWEDMSTRIILRPKNNPSVYLGNALFSVGHVSYTQVFNSTFSSSSSTTTTTTSSTPLIERGADVLIRCENPLNRKQIDVPVNSHLLGKVGGAALCPIEAPRFTYTVAHKPIII